MSVFPALTNQTLVSLRFWGFRCFHSCCCCCCCFNLSVNISLFSSLFKYLFAFLSCCLCKMIWYLCYSGGMIGCAGACRCSKFLQFGSFSMAKTAIASNRAVPGKYTALEHKYAIKFFCQAFQVMWRKKSHNPWLYFSSPLLSLYIFFFFILEQLCFVMTALATRAL